MPRFPLSLLQLPRPNRRPASWPAGFSGFTSLISITISFAVAALLFAFVTSARAADSGKPTLLYSRHYNAAGESRYLPAGTYREILRHLAADFEVRSNDDPINEQTLAGVSLLLIANPSDKAVGSHPAPAHFSGPDIEALVRFVQRGGGLVILGNQENHNLEVEHTNLLLERFGLAFTNLYTDAKQLKIPTTTPLLGGLRWAYYTGNQVRITPNHSSHARALVENDLLQKPLGGTRDSAGALLAIAEPGQGRVAVATDAGWLTDDALSGRGIGSVAIKEHDNVEICRRLFQWVAHRDNHDSRAKAH